MPARPMLGDLELPQVQDLALDEDQVLVRHAVPALEGDFHQGINRRAYAVNLSGVLTEDDDADGLKRLGDELKKLRDQFRAAAPVPFVSDITTATRVDRVLIQEMDVRELAGRPSRFEYAFLLREYIPAPRPVTEKPPEPPAPPTPPPPSVDTGTLVVEVIVADQAAFDFSTATVTIEGTTNDQASFSKTLANRNGGVWTEEGVPPGTYTVRAVTSNPRTGSASVTTQPGQTTRTSITLQPGAVIATAFVVHFRFDKSFVEPCMRQVLKQVAEYAGSHTDQKLVVVGHTDKTGSDHYNQSLSERRARSVFAYLTAGRDATASEAEWNALRPGAQGELPTLKDTWGTHQYQYMLQDLGFYPGNVDGKHGQATDEAVTSYRSARGLPPGTQVDDAVWTSLIHDYLAQDHLSVPEAQFPRNADPDHGCDAGILEWLGCGEEQPLPLPQPTVLTAHRQYRRVELLFVNAARLPCQVPRPDTFDKPGPGPVAPSWCLGPPSGGSHSCFASRTCSAPPSDSSPWCIQPAENGTVRPRIEMRFEDGTPAAGIDYILIAPDGKFMDGEVAAGTRAGEGILGRTGPDGSHQYTTDEAVGIYTLEIRGDFIAHSDGEPASEAKGNVVCARLDQDHPNFVVILIPSGRNAPPVNPVIDAESRVVVVKKPYTNPARKRVTLKTDGPFFRPGTLKVTGNTTAITFFKEKVGGAALQFDGKDNVFSGSQLTHGVDLFAGGTTASTQPDDVTLALTLTPGVSKVGDPATVTMTSAELTLDICPARTSAGVEPTPLPESDKIDPGRTLSQQDPGNHQERAILIVRAIRPAGLADAVLELAPLNDKVQLFGVENPAAGQVPLATPQSIPDGTLPGDGQRLFAQGSRASSTERDTGFRLGLAGVEPEGDLVKITVTPVVTLRLIDDLDRVISGIPFRIEAGTQSFSGTIGSDGFIVQPLPFGTTTAKLVLESKLFHRVDPATNQTQVSVWSIELDVKELEPASVIAGARARLNNLGLFAGPQASGGLDEQAGRALQRFQALYEIPQTGDLTDPTPGKLQDKYGS